MKLFSGIIILTLIMIIITSGCVDNETDTKPIYKIGVDAAMSPWEYVDVSGNPQGINIDMMNLIAENQGFDVEYYVPENAEWEKALSDKKIDTIGAVIVTPERLDKYNFVEYPFEPTRYLVISRADSDVSYEDFLAGKASIAVPENSAYVDWLKNHFGEDYDKMVSEGKIITKVTADELALSVMSHEADTAVAGMMTLGSQLNIYHPLKYLGFVGEPNKIGYILRKDDTELYGKLSEGLKNIEKTPEFSSLIKKYNLQYLKEVYIVGIDEYNKPWTYVDADGKYAGFDIEMMEWIADKNNFNLEFKPSTWDRNINEIILGDIDMWASSMAVTDERLNSVAFSEPYYISGIGAAVIYDSGLTKSDLDKPQALITTVYGTTYENWLENYVGKDLFGSKLKDGSITLVSNGKEMIERLSSGKSDFAISGETQIKDDNSLKPVYIEEGIEEYAVVMSNVNFVLQDIINEGISEFISSGKSEELKEKYGLL